MASVLDGQYPVGLFQVHRLRYARKDGQPDCPVIAYLHIRVLRFHHHLAV